MKDHPNASAFRDRHGKIRWRFRRGSKSIALPHQPGHPEFEAAYLAAANGLPKPAPSTVTRHPAETPQRSLRAAWRLVLKSPEWAALGETSRIMQIRNAERFLTSPVPGIAGATYGDMPIDRIERRHVKAILAERRDTPHAASHVLRMLRKMIAVALDEEWIKVDPTHKVTYRPPTEGHRAWTEAERKAFEGWWEIGETPRLVYALALYTGARRSDIATMRWSDIDTDGAGIAIAQEKTGRPIWVPIHPELRAVLAATPRTAETIVTTIYGEPFSVKSLGMRMRSWCKEAGVPEGATLHGLRKSMGKALAESGATTREIMAVLGHEDIEHAALYSKEAEQKTLAKAAMAKLARSGIRSVKG